EFQSAKGSKLKRPFRYMVSCLRALGADTYAHQPLVEYLTRMGQPPYQYPTPDGYPEKSSAWVGTLLWRWNFAFALVSKKIESANVDLDKFHGLGLTAENAPDKLFSYLVGRKPRAEELTPLAAYCEKFGLADYARRQEFLGIILASPAFQRH